MSQILLVIIVSELIIVAVVSCIKFTKGPLSIGALKNYLRLLQSKFIHHALIDPDVERQEIEMLQNKVKTSCSQLTISENADLQGLFLNTCQNINDVMTDKEIENRTSWLKFREVICNFQESYFSKKPVVVA
jgi:hypothetical protein